MKRLLFGLLLMIVATAQPALCAHWPGKETTWHDAARYDFTMLDREVTVIVPEKPLPGNPWIWRPAFFDAFPDIDIAMLEKGYHILYFNVTNEWGRPSALSAGKKFYDFAVGHGLMDRVILEGLSRGGYYSLCWAQHYPEHVAALLLDNPLVDLRELKKNDEWFSDVVSKWREDSIENPEVFHNAVNNLTPIVKNRIPILLLSGGSDTIVPYERNGKIIKDTYRRWGVPMKSIVRPHSGHHPHSMSQPEPAVKYLAECIYGKADSTLRVACIGDSMTEGVGTDDFSTQSYPAILQSLLGDGYKVGNFGVSCATMLKNGKDAGNPFGYSGLPAMQKALDYNPDIVVIALGVNDCKSYNWEKHGQEFISDYQDMINTFRMLPSIPEIYLVVEPYVCITPHTSSWGFEDKGYYEEMMSHIITLSNDNKLTVIPLTDIFRGEEHDCYAPNDHPNPRGAAMMANAIKNVIAGNNQ